MKFPVVVATAGWSIPASSRGVFPGQGTHLERYARILPGVEINSTFYKPHQPKTFARWATSTPPDFRFAVKMPRAITHERRLVDADENLKQFLSEVSNLGSKLGPILIQLPPSFVFEAKTALKFFDLLRKHFSEQVALEPRHASWFSTEVNTELRKRKIARVKADPAKPMQADQPGGYARFVYYRLHGSPRIYWSNYTQRYLHKMAKELSAHRALGARVWCVFDNTAAGCATKNALALKKTLDRSINELSGR